MPHPLGSPSRMPHDPERLMGTYAHTATARNYDLRNSGVKLRRHTDVFFVRNRTLDNDDTSRGSETHRAAKAETQLVLFPTKPGSDLCFPIICCDRPSRLAGRGAGLCAERTRYARDDSEGVTREKAAKASAETKHYNRNEVTDALLAGALMLVALAWAASVVLL